MPLGWYLVFVFWVAVWACMNGWVGEWVGWMGGFVYVIFLFRLPH